jgi:hypothetical protein
MKTAGVKRRPFLFADTQCTELLAKSGAVAGFALNLAVIAHVGALGGVRFFAFGAGEGGIAVAGGAGDGLLTVADGAVDDVSGGDSIFHFNDLAEVAFADFEVSGAGDREATPADTVLTLDPGADGEFEAGARARDFAIGAFGVGAFDCAGAVAGGTVDANAEVFAGAFAGRAGDDTITVAGGTELVFVIDLPLVEGFLLGKAVGDFGNIGPGDPDGLGLFGISGGLDGNGVRIGSDEFAADGRVVGFKDDDEGERFFGRVGGEEGVRGEKGETEEEESKEVAHESFLFGTW